MFAHGVAVASAGAPVGVSAAAGAAVFMEAVCPSLNSLSDSLKTNPSCKFKKYKSTDHYEQCNKFHIFIFTYIDHI